MTIDDLKALASQYANGTYINATPANLSGTFLDPTYNVPQFSGDILAYALAGMHPFTVVWQGKKLYVDENGVVRDSSGRVTEYHYNPATRTIYNGANQPAVTVDAAGNVYNAVTGEKGGSYYYNAAYDFANVSRAGGIQNQEDINNWAKNYQSGLFYNQPASGGTAGSGGTTGGAGGTGGSGAGATVWTGGGQQTTGGGTGTGGTGTGNTGNQQYPYVIYYNGTLYYGDANGNFYDPSGNKVSFTWRLDSDGVVYVYDANGNKLFKLNDDYTLSDMNGNQVGYVTNSPYGYNMAAGQPGQPVTPTQGSTNYNLASLGDYSHIGTRSIEDLQKIYLDALLTAASYNTAQNYLRPRPNQQYYSPITSPYTQGLLNNTRQIAQAEMNAALSSMPQIYQAAKNVYDYAASVGSGARMNTPWMQQLQRTAQNILTNTPQTVQQTTADMKQLRDAGMQMFRNAASATPTMQAATLGYRESPNEALSAARRSYSTAQSYIDRTLGGAYLGGNPYVNDIIQRSIAAANAQNNANAVKYGAYGSTDSAYMRNKTAGDIASSLLYQNYNAERQLQNQALQMAPSVGRILTEPYEAQEQRRLQAAATQAQMRQEANKANQAARLALQTATMQMTPSLMQASMAPETARLQATLDMPKSLLVGSQVYETPRQYESELQRNVIGGTPAMLSLPYSGMQRGISTMEYDAAQRNAIQQWLDQQWDKQQMYPWQTLQLYHSIVGNMPAQITTPNQLSGTGSTQNWLGAALLGAGIFGQMGGWDWLGKQLFGGGGGGSVAQTGGNTFGQYLTDSVMQWLLE